MALHIATTDDLADLERDIARILADVAAERAARLSLESRVAALESVPPPQPDPDPGPEPDTKALLTAGALHQTRVWKLPTSVAGGSTGYCAGLLAARMVGGELQFLSDTHLNTAGNLYAFRLPESGDTVEVVAEPMQALYEGKRPSGKRVNGLLIPASDPNSLYWVGDRAYDSVDKTDTVAFRTQLKPDSWEPAEGIEEEQYPNPTGSNNLWTRGGFLELPDGRILRGLGGYYSIISGGSAGPCIVAQDGTVYLGYPWLQHHAPRPDDFTTPTGEFDPNDWVTPFPGQWTASDKLGGENYSSFAFQLNDPEFKGIVFGVQQGTDVRQYGTGGALLGAPPMVSRLYVYDPVEVFDANLSPWEPTAHYYDLPLPEFPNLQPGALASGGVYLPSERKVYVVWVKASKPGNIESYPILVEYEIRQPIA